MEPSLVEMGVVADEGTQDQHMGLSVGTSRGGANTGIPSYEESLEAVEGFVSDLDINSLRTLCLRLLEGHGGVSLAKSILEATPEEPQPPEPNQNPDWCICNNCHPMPSPTENVCCQRRQRIPVMMCSNLYVSIQ